MKILCIGNNSQQTDELASKLAKELNDINFGLIANIDQEIKDGIYHTSVYDIAPEYIVILSEKFDRIVVLDQPLESWEHPTAFYNTINLKKYIDRIEFQNNNISINYWENLVNENKSFCIFPFIELLTQNGYTTVCCRSHTKIKDIDNISDFNNDSDYTAIRDSLLAGKQIPHCRACYKDEENNMLSARQQESVEWANFLNLTSIDDLKNLNGPYYYEVRPSNICNLQCRICGPSSSHLIEKEYSQIGLHDPTVKFTHHNFDIIDINKVKKLYVAGGEPTAMPTFYNFLEKCIAQKQTNFEILVNTNGQKISTKLLTLGKQFTNLHYIVSIDGYGKANEYSRWPSNWNKTVANIKKLINNNHKVTFNITLSLYTIFSFKELVYFLQDSFPDCLIHGQFAHNVSPFMIKFDQDLIEKLELIRKTPMYKGNNLFNSFVDTVITNSQNSTTDIKKLKKFFKTNDALDRSRNVRLKDYIPNLEQHRPINLNYCSICGHECHCGIPLYKEQNSPHDEFPITIKVCDNCRCDNCKK